MGGNNGLSIFNRVTNPFGIVFDKILTPKTEIPYNNAITEIIPGIVNDRFCFDINPMIYNPSNSKLKYQTRLIDLDEDSKNPWSPPRKLSL